MKPAFAVTTIMQAIMIGTFWWVGRFLKLETTFGEVTVFVPILFTCTFPPNNH